MHVQLIVNAHTYRIMCIHMNSTMCHVTWRWKQLETIGHHRKLLESSGTRRNPLSTNRGMTKRSMGETPSAVFNHYS